MILGITYIIRKNGTLMRFRFRLIFDTCVLHESNGKSNNGGRIK
jgi:hypothetical protein